MICQNNECAWWNLVEIVIKLSEQSELHRNVSNCRNLGHESGICHDGASIIRYCRSIDIYWYNSFIKNSIPCNFLWKISVHAIRHILCLQPDWPQGGELTGELTAFELMINHGYLSFEVSGGHHVPNKRTSPQHLVMVQIVQLCLAFLWFCWKLFWQILEMINIFDNCQMVVRFQLQKIT